MYFTVAAAAAAVAVAGHTPVPHCGLLLACCRTTALLPLLYLSSQPQNITALYSFPSCCTDWAVHKKYCKRLIFVKKTELKDFVEGGKKADPSKSEAYQAALRAAADDQARSMVLVTPIAAQCFVQVGCLAAAVEHMSCLKIDPRGAR
jgi:hypothetical protein